VTIVAGDYYYYRVGIHKAKSNSCYIGFMTLICAVAYENDRFGTFDKEIQ
jgi:hypothetical protein